MAAKYSPDTVLADAAKIIETWTTNTDFTLGPVKLADFKKQRDALILVDCPPNKMFLTQGMLRACRY